MLVVMLRVMLRGKRGTETAPGAREGGDHLVHEAREGVGGHARDGVLAADDGDAPLAQRRQQRLAHQAAGRAEGPALQACARHSICLKRAVSHCTEPIKLYEGPGSTSSFIPLQIMCIKQANLAAVSRLTHVTRQCATCK